MSTTSLAACGRCGVQVLRQSEFLQACRDAGLFVDELGRVALRLGGIAGTGETIGRTVAEQQTRQQARHDEIENRKGFQCTSCRGTYCTNCLFRHAPAHPRGGKACPSCGGTFTYYV